MILPNCKHSAVYFRFLTLKESKNALFGDEKFENIMFKFAGYNERTLPCSGQGRVTVPCEQLCYVVKVRQQKKVFHAYK
jgi:hypothetical protein